MPDEPVAQLDLVTAIRQGLHCRAGDEFQSIAQDILRHRIRGFQAIAPHGRDGDGGNDGYSRDLGIYTQIYAPRTSPLPGRQAARKAVKDFAKIRRSWGNIRAVKEFWFITNAAASNIHLEQALKDIATQFAIKTRFLGTPELADEVAALSPNRIEELMGFTVETRSRATQPSSALDLLASLSPSQLNGLHQLASIGHPVPPKLCEDLLPHAANWKALWPWLFRRGLAKQSADLIELSEEVVAQCRRNTAEQKRACAAWVSPLLDHGSTDCLYLAILPLLTLGRWKEVVQVVIRAGLECSEDEWAGIMLEVMDLLNTQPAMNRLPMSDRNALKLARANLLLRAGRHREAVEVYDVHLRKGLAWPKQVCRGDILINYGVAAQLSGDDTRARQQYEKALVWARANRDDWRFGRAATNLAQMLGSTELERAEALINEAERAKLRCGDAVGLIGIEMAKGILAANRYKPARAHRHFKSAQRLAKSLDQADVLVDISFNLGKSSGEMGLWREAESEYQRSLTLAVKSAQADREARARAGLAETYFFLAKWDGCKEQCDRLIQLPADATWSNLRLVGLHGRMVLQLRAKGSAEPDGLAEALAFARQSGRQDWVGRLLTDSTLGRSAPPTLNDIKTLLSTGIAEEAAERHEAAVRVYGQCWHWCALKKEIAADLHDHAESLLDRLLDLNKVNPVVAVEYLKWKYNVCVQLGEPWKAISALAMCARRALKAKLWDDYASVLDQHAVTLLKLDRPESAEPLHRRAFRVAARCRLPERQRISLGNLAECLRRMGRTKSAYRMSAKALTLHDPVQDPAEYVSVLHNHYLIQRALGLSSASRTLNRCEAMAQKHGLVNETMRAFMARGNAAWDRGNITRACEYFRRALRLGERANITTDMDDCRYNLALALKETGRIKEALRVVGDACDVQQIGIPQMRQIGLAASLLEGIGELSAAAKAWHEAAVIAATVEQPALRSEYRERSSFLGIDEDGTSRVPVAVARQADRYLKKIYNVRMAELQHRLDAANAFYARNALPQYQVHALHAFATRASARGRAAYLTVAAQASVASIVMAGVDETNMRMAMKMHIHWLLSLKLSSTKIQSLKARTRTWLSELLAAHDLIGIGASLLSGFDAATKLSSRSRALTPGRN